MRERPYHHGDLRRAVLAEAAEVIADVGVADLSLRALARRLGVSHAAPAHHFRDRTGLLTALAAQGHAILAEEMSRVVMASSNADCHGRLVELGVAYIRFAARYPAHFTVMFQPELCRADDAELRAARELSSQVLAEAVTDSCGDSAPGFGGQRLSGLAAWSIVHGFVALWQSGALPGDLGEDLEVAAHRVVGPLLAPA